MSLLDEGGMGGDAGGAEMAGGSRSRSGSGAGVGGLLETTELEECLSTLAVDLETRDKQVRLDLLGVLFGGSFLNEILILTRAVPAG